MARSIRTKRGQGRPSDVGVGKDAIVAATKKLLRKLPPARVTTAAIAREAGIDPALIRYYFGDRTNLLLAVAQSMTRATPRVETSHTDPIDILRDAIAHTARFTRSTPYMHRLMVDELADAKSDAVREQLAEMNRNAAVSLANVIAESAGALRAVDPLFLHIALIGMFDFFTSANPVIRSLVPEGTDLDALGDRYMAFVADLLIEGLKAR